MRGVTQEEKRGRNGTLSIGSLIRSARGIRTARRQGVGASISSVKRQQRSNGGRTTDSSDTSGGGGDNNNGGTKNNNSMAT